MKILIFMLAILAFSVVTTDIAYAVQTCVGVGATTREDPSSSSARTMQSFIAPSAPITSITWNVYGDPAETDNWHLQILNMSGGLPDPTSIVAGSIIQIPIDESPDEPVGTGQAFVCSEIDEPKMQSQTFTYVTPVNLTPGVEYAISVHETGTFGLGTTGYFTGFPSVVPGTGFNCSSSCTNIFETQFPGGSGINYDYMYSFNDEVIEVNSNDGKIDGQIQQLREYLELDGTDGGLMFGLGIMGIIFAIGLMSKVPFLIVAMLNLLLVGIFSRAQIMPPWVILAVVAVAGIAVIFRMIGGTNRSGQSES